MMRTRVRRQLASGPICFRAKRSEAYPSTVCAHASVCVRLCVFLLILCDRQKRKVQEDSDDEAPAVARGLVKHVSGRKVGESRRLTLSAVCTRARMRMCISGDVYAISCSAKLKLRPTRRKLRLRQWLVGCPSKSRAKRSETYPVRPVYVCAHV